MESSDSDRRGEEDRVEMGLVVGSTTAVIFTSGLAARCGRCHPGLSIIYLSKGRRDQIMRNEMLWIGQTHNHQTFQDFFSHDQRSYLEPTTHTLLLQPISCYPPSSDRFMERGLKSRCWCLGWAP